MVFVSPIFIAWNCLRPWRRCCQILASWGDAPRVPCSLSTARQGAVTLSAERNGELRHRMPSLPPCFDNSVCCSQFCKMLRQSAHITLRTLLRHHQQNVMTIKIERPSYLKQKLSPNKLRNSEEARRLTLAISAIQRSALAYVHFLQGRGEISCYQYCGTSLVQPFTMVIFVRTNLCFGLTLWRLN